MSTPKISFFRQYYGYTGGHKKVFDYINHILSLNWQPTLFLDNKAKTNCTLFENMAGVSYQPYYDPSHSDVVFLASMDWQYYLPNRTEMQPVVNLIQHVRHADPTEKLHQYLAEPAVRLCVSDAVKNAILPYANGPCYSIKMGHALPDITVKKEFDLYILANKQPTLGGAIFDWAKKRALKVQMHDVTTESNQVHSAMASAHITVALPNETEGFYLPGIEGMWLSDAAVVPDCIANREYNSRWANIYQPVHDFGAITKSIEKALKTPYFLQRIRAQRGRNIVMRYSLNSEFKALRKVLSRHF